MSKNIIITGASSGLGIELAKQYCKDGNNLLLIARNEAKLTKFQKLNKNNNCTIDIAICDVRDNEKLKNIILKYQNKNPIDLLIANAGISGGTAQGQESYLQFMEIFNTNIYGVINSIYSVIDHFKSKNSGQIVIISSMASFKGLPSAPAYSSSKACVRFIGESLRAELKRYNIKVNIICPGYIKTPMTDQNKFPMPLIYKVEKAAAKIIKAIDKNTPILIFPKIIYYVISLTNLLPVKFSDKIYASMPKKK